MIVLLLLKPTSLIIKPYIPPQTLRKGVNRDTRSEELLVVASERTQSERPAVQSTAENHIVVDWVNTRKTHSLRAGVDDGVDVLQHGDQLVVGLGGRQFEIGDETVHLGESYGDGDILSDCVTQAAFGVEHNSFHCVNADNTAVCYTKTQ